MDAQLFDVAPSGPVSSVLRLAHTALDGTIESFVNIYDNMHERLVKRKEPFREPLDGMVAIVTGGNAGIGFATAQQLARRGAHVVLACRDKGRAEAAVQAIARTPPLDGCCKTHWSAANTAAPNAANTRRIAAAGSFGASDAPSVLASSGVSSAAPPSPSPPPSLRVESMELDLGRLSSVRRFAEEWRRRGLPLHLLVCNAGVMGPPQRLETADGLEMQFQVNFLSHWLLANELMAVERERRCAGGDGRSSAAFMAEGEGAVGVGRGWATRGRGSPDSDWASGGGSTRVVMVTSLTHRAGALQWHDKQSRLSYEPFLSYGLSKLANILTAKELQRRFDRSSEYGQDTAVAVHPGLVSTDLANGFFAHRSTGWAASTPLKTVVEAAVGGLSQAIGPLLMRTPEQSAAVMLHACLAPPRFVAGHYLALGRTTQPDQAAEDASVAADLWSYAEQLTGYTPHPSLRQAARE